MPCSDTANGSAKTACLVGDGVRDLEQHRVVRGHELAEAAGHVLAHPGVDAGRERTDAERPALAQVAGHARRAVRLDAARPAGEPRVQRDAVADLEALGLGPERDDVGDHLVAHHVRERHEVLHRVVGEPLPGPVRVGEARVVEEDLLRLGAADAGEARLGDHPVGPQEARVVHLDESASALCASIFRLRLSVSGSGTDSGLVPNSRARMAGSNMTSTSGPPGGRRYGEIVSDGRGASSSA